MKVDYHGIRFRLMVTFIALACGTILLLGLLLTGFIKPYYRNAKIKTAKVLATTLTEDLLAQHDDNAQNIRNAFAVTVDNNACVILFNEDGRAVYTADQLGEGCVFHQDVNTDTNINFNAFETLTKMVEDENGSFSLDLTNEVTGQKMLVYGEEVKADLANYYLFINTPLEPVDSLISFFTRQYITLMIVTIIMAIIVSVYLSGKIVKPIIDMEKETYKLSQANYDVNFDGGTLTETKNLAKALNTASKQLSQIENMRRSLMANLSHDIKTPLTNIKAYAEMIQDISGDDPKKRQKHIDVIIRETEYMSKLIHDMSELSRIQNGAYVLKKKNIDLVEIIHDVILMHSALIDARNIEVIFHLPPSLVIYADEIKMVEVIQNYITNAIKHSDDHSKITITGYVMRDEETVRVEVKDEGEGISLEEQKFIWDRYQKASSTFYRQIESTGLGLAIVKAILEAHHAQYGVISKPNEGSTFWFTIKEKHDEV